MSESSGSKQSKTAIEKNIAFFRDHAESYGARVAQLDTYQNLRAAANESLRGLGRLLDIGNGGTFDYDTALVGEIVAVDLFIEEMPAAVFPANVVPRNGSALDLPLVDGEFDGVLMAMLVHHLVGHSVAESLRNVRRAIQEAVRVLKPGGRLVIVESCVPEWFYAFEKIVFPPVAKVLSRFTDHPATLQLPRQKLAAIIGECACDVSILKVPKGRWILQYGVKFPAAMTPAQPYRFTARKPG